MGNDRVTRTDPGEGDQRQRSSNDQGLTEPTDARASDGSGGNRLVLGLRVTADLFLLRMAAHYTVILHPDARAKRSRGVQSDKK